MRKVLMPIVLLLLLVLGIRFNQFARCSQKSAVVTVNLKAIKAQFIRQLAEHKASDESIARATMQFKQALQKILLAYSQRHGAVILDRQAVLSGGRDMTDDFVSALGEAMRKKQ